ncbi:head-tail connector protein [Aquamicrobium soli]|uniref:Head-tail connector protein n=1 Tax=Aquamicrobium soli TaxID=1811518 RepID=A0ABV7KH97_9HYPH
MWYPSTVTEAPTTEPVTLDEVKQQCLVDSADDDDLLKRLIKAARSHVEEYCNARWAEQTLACQCDNFADFSRLSEGPLKSVTSVQYVAATGETQTLDASVYEARKDELEPSIALKPGQRWPSILPGSRITLTAVFGGDVPDAVHHAMLVFIDAAYHVRENPERPGWTVMDVLLCNHRRGA